MISWVEHKNSFITLGPSTKCQQKSLTKGSITLITTAKIARRAHLFDFIFNYRDDERDDYNFEIVLANLPFLDVNVPRSSSVMVYIFRRLFVLQEYV